ncbi:hypothetical protein, partial [Mycolicibacterium sp.]|uniref:hypothetical protein n=1 Tax=Mycolicibacterium sp. TaxID=2320850 RepID=UPI0037C8E3FA
DDHHPRHSEDRVVVRQPAPGAVGSGCAGPLVPHSWAARGPQYQSVNDFGEFFTQRRPGPVGARPKVCAVRDESAPQERQFVRKGCFMGGVLERLQTAMYLTLTAAFLGVALSALVAVLVAAAPLKLLALIDRQA